MWQSAVDYQSTKRVATLKYGNFKMACDLREMLQRQFYFFGTYFLEEHILTCWETAARDAKVIFDVGANAGIYSLAALAVRPNATVYAFEPTPEIAARLRATAALNGLNQLHIHEVAISRKTGQAVLKRFRGETGTNEGMNYISEEIGDSSDECVQTVCLDQFCNDHRIDQIDLLKLDIQGNEHLALAGAEHLLQTGRVGVIFAELNWARNAHATCPASEAIRLMEKSGYQFSQPGKRLHWRKSGEWLFSLSDVVARRPVS